MDQHKHPEYTTHQDLNGFGKRVNDVEGDTRENTVRSGRNEADVTRLFELAGENTRGINGLEKTVAALVGKVSGYVAAASAAVIIAAEIVKHFLGKGAP